MIVTVLSDRRHVYECRYWTDVRCVYYGRNIKTCKLEGLSHHSTSIPGACWKN